jgi:hypothetical protein
MANSKTETRNRAEAIRRFVDEMKSLVADRRVAQRHSSAAQRRVVALRRRASKELGFTPDDFAMGVSLAALAERGKQDTVNSIREIMLALGNSLPAIAEGPTITRGPPEKIDVPAHEPPTRKRDLVIQVLSTHGPMTAAELQTRLADIGGEFPVAPHLTHLARNGRVKHQGTQWSST